MDIKCYLAITAAEFASADTIPEHFAWMACHFSSYGTGLSNIPTSIPRGSMVIVNDRTPPHGHDPYKIADQLNALIEDLDVSCFLLDFQRADDTETTDIAQILCNKVTAVVGVTEQYATPLDCPVFIRSPLPYELLSERVSLWEGRKIWLEAAIETVRTVINEDGSHFQVINDSNVDSIEYRDSSLRCSYRTDLYSDHALITLQRTAEDITELLKDASGLGIELSVGLYQQLRKIIT